MKKKLFICYVWLLAVVVSAQQSEEKSDDNEVLQMVHLVYRHGARSPIEIYPTNMYKNHWLDGTGMLTKKGMNLEYNLGKFLKKRYMEDTKLLNTSYIHQQVYIRSSDVPRCLQSAETQLAGLYPPQGRQIWNQEIRNWQPIPVHTVPLAEELLLRADTEDTCPRLKELWDAKRASPEYKAKQEQHQPLMSFLTNYTGWNVTFDNLWKINDDFVCEKAEALPPPNWITPPQIQEMHDLNNWVFLDRYKGDDELGRILGGTLLGVMINNMKQYKDGKYRDQLYKVIFFSGHDTSLLSLSAGLDIDLVVPPPFATCLMVELYNNSNGGYFVQMVYRNDSSGDSYPLKLKNCDVKCPLETFVQLLANRVADEKDRDKICGVILPPPFFNEARLKIISIVFFVLTIVFLIVIIGLMIRKHVLRKRMIDYHAAVRDEENKHLINNYRDVASSGVTM